MLGQMKLPDLDQGLLKIVLLMVRLLGHLQEIICQYDILLRHTFLVLLFLFDFILFMLLKNLLDLSFRRILKLIIGGCLLRVSNGLSAK